MPSPDPAERELWRGNPALRNWWPSLAVAGALAVAVLPLYVYGLGRWAAVAPLLAAALAAAVAVRSRVQAYRLSSQRLRSSKGLLAVECSEVELGDIRNLKLRQSLAQRLLGVGDIEIESSGGPGVEIRLESIARPADVMELIRQARLALPARPSVQA